MPGKITNISHRYIDYPTETTTVPDSCYTYNLNAMLV